MKYLMILVLLCSYTCSPAQSAKVPLRVSLFNEATAIPFTRFFTTPVHPGIQAGTEFNFRQYKHSRLFLTANISYFYHNYIAQGIGIFPEAGYEYRTNKGISLAGLIGLGYLHTFATTEEFSFTNGSYEKKSDKGNSRFYPSFSLETGYFFRKEDKQSPAVFIRYQAWAEYPFSPGFIPVMTHISLHAGMKIFLRIKKAKEDE